MQNVFPSTRGLSSWIRGAWDWDSGGVDGLAVELFVKGDLFGHGHFLATAAGFQADATALFTAPLAGVTIGARVFLRHAHSPDPF